MKRTLLYRLPSIMDIGDNKCKFYNLDFYPLIIYIKILPTRNYELTRNKINQVEKKCFPHIYFLQNKNMLGVPDELES